MFLQHIGIRSYSVSDDTHSTIIGIGIGTSLLSTHTVWENYYYFFSNFDHFIKAALLKQWSAETPFLYSLPRTQPQIKAVTNMNNWWAGRHYHRDNTAVSVGAHFRVNACVVSKIGMLHVFFCQKDFIRWIPILCFHLFALIITDTYKPCNSTAVTAQAHWQAEFTTLLSSLSFF